MIFLQTFKKNQDMCEKRKQNKMIFFFYEKSGHVQKNCPLFLIYSGSTADLKTSVEIKNITHSRK